METSRERWLELCELTTSEHDSKKLLALVEEINLLLEAEIRDVEVKRCGLADNPPTPARLKVQFLPDGPPVSVGSHSVCQ